MRDTSSLLDKSIYEWQKSKKKSLNENYFNTKFSSNTVHGSVGGGEGKKQGFILGVESSQVSTTPVADLTNPNVPNSKILVFNANNRNFLFSFEPPDVPLFKNANEIFRIGKDLYVVYYWNTVTAGQTSRIVRFSNIEVNATSQQLVYSNVEYVDTTVRTIHAFANNDTHLFLSSRNESKIVKIGLSDPLSSLEVFTNAAIINGSDSLALVGDNLYVGTYAVWSVNYRGKVIAVPTSNPAATAETVLTFASNPTKSSRPTINTDGKYVYATEYDFAYSTSTKLYRIDAQNHSSVDVLNITLPLPGDLHCIFFGGGSIWVTTGRNPFLIQIDQHSFMLKTITTITEAQVPDPVPSGFYGSPETGYITDDNVYFDGFIYLGSEVAKQGVVIINANLLSSRSFYEVDYDVFGLNSFIVYS